MKLKILHPLFYFALSIYAGNLSAQSKSKSIKWLKTNGTSLSEVFASSKENTEHPKMIFKIEKADRDSLYYYQYDENKLSLHSIAWKNILYENFSTLENKYDSQWQTNGVIIKYNLARNTLRLKKSQTNTLKNIFIPYTDKEKAERILNAIMNISRESGAQENKQYF